MLSVAKCCQVCIDVFMHVYIHCYIRVVFDILMIYCFRRWPWQLFRILHPGCGPMDLPSHTRKTLAKKLLDIPENHLDGATRRIRTLRNPELRHLANTGVFVRGSLLHAVLSMSALRLKLDSGELESLNSQIKTTIEQGSTQMSLELLSSRENTRKTLTLAAGGNTKLKVVKPLAQNLAKSSPLYQGMENTILLDSDRWGPPPPVQMTSHKPDVCDQLTEQQRWALKYNKMLMKAFRHHQQKT